MNSHHSFVRSWLESIFGDSGDPIPSYEVSESNLSFLYELSSLSQSRTREAQLLGNLHRKQISEYKAESDRLNKALGVVGLDPHRLSGPVEKFAEVLTDLSLVLDLDDPSENEVCLRLSEIQVRSSGIPVRDLRLVKSQKEEKKKLLEALKELSQNQVNLKTIEANSRRHEENSQQSKKKLLFMEQKQKEYLRTLEKYDALLKRNGFQKELQHDVLVVLKKQLDSLKETYAPLKSKLDSYEELPPNLELAMVKVAEAQKGLDDLTNELTEEISALHV